MNWFWSLGLGGWLWAAGGCAAAPALRFSLASQAGGQRLILAWDTLPGKTYAAEFTASLGQPWQRLAVAAAPAGAKALELAEPINSTARFYRILEMDSRAGVAGRVTDAVTGLPVAEAAVASGGRTTFTDASGAYQLTGLEPGSETVDFTANPLAGPVPLTVQFRNLSASSGAWSTITASKSGYLPYTNSWLALRAGESSRLDFSLSPVHGGRLRLVLNWGARPPDLDACLQTPEIQGASWLVWYQGANRGASNAPPYALLDFDRQDGYGPETITIDRFFPGAYHYYVHQFNETGGTGELRDSSAVVQVYDGEGLVQTVAIPTTGTGEYWDVLTIDGSTGGLTVINRIQSAKPSAPYRPPGRPVSRLSAEPGAAAGATKASAVYTWDFGDGAGSQLENPVHTYRQPGLFDVTLTVSRPGMASQQARKPQYIEVLAPPVILQPPVDLVATQGLQAAFSVVAGGRPPFSYQWYGEESYLLGQTRASLVFTNVQEAFQGYYHVEVANGGGTVASQPVFLRVLSPPRILSAPTNQVVEAGSRAVFSVSATGTAPLAYQWQLDGASLAESAVFTGVRSPELVIPAAATNLAGLYRVIVSNPVGMVSTSATLAVKVTVVLPQPDPTRWRWIAGGIFTMGSPATEKDRDTDEGPLRRVAITRGFHMGVHEVTQAEWLAVMGATVAQQRDRVDRSKPLKGEGDRHPIYYVSWEEANEYCRRLTALEEQAGRLPAGYVIRLPTEAEWEFASRGGVTNRFSFGDDLDYGWLPEFAWFKTNAGDATHPVEKRRPNITGLSDLHGNVYEWCWDWYLAPYLADQLADPTGPSLGLQRVVRGGCFYDEAKYCRSANRMFYPPGTRDFAIGFRVVIAPGIPR